MVTTRAASARRIMSLFAIAMAFATPIAVEAQPAGIDPEATRILKTSTDFIAGQKKFTVSTRNTLEVVLTSGQKVQFEHTAKQSMQRPDRMRAERTGDLVQQAFYYDGKSLTISNPATRHYATVDAPPTVEEMLDFARTKLDIVAPASDLVYRNAYDILMTDVTQGFVVGKGIVEGVRCDHLAFRAPLVDLQIWIQEGEQPLPRRFVITTRDVVNAPQFAVTVTRWNLEPTFDAQTFGFTPPADATKVDFLPR